MNEKNDLWYEKKFSKSYTTEHDKSKGNTLKWNIAVCKLKLCEDVEKTSLKRNLM